MLSACGMQALKPNEVADRSFSNLAVNVVMAFEFLHLGQLIPHSNTLRLSLEMNLVGLYRNIKNLICYTNWNDWI